MDWLQVRIELGRLAPAPVEAALLELGAVAVQYQDGGDEPILEPAPGTTPLWQDVVLSALLTPETPADHVRLAVAAAVAPARLPPITFESLADQDWVGQFSRQLAPQKFGDSLWLIPPGTAAPADADAIVQLEPGLAFGSGSHPTTALCLEWLAARRCQGTVLDFGCGSGVLALAAAALGASQVWAVDIDAQALQASTNNAVLNGMQDRIRVLAPAALPADLRCDAVVANILSGPLIELAPDLGSRLYPGASLALTGILWQQADAVRAAYRPWIDFDPDSRRGEWALLSGRARGSI